MLVADLPEESARDFLEGVARENDEAWVPLLAAPVNGSPHLLEVYTPSSSEPLRLLAELTGPPTEHGFPLRLSLLADDAPESLRVPTVEEVAIGDEMTIEPVDPLIGRQLELSLKTKFQLHNPSPGFADNTPFTPTCDCRRPRPSPACRAMTAS